MIMTPKSWAYVALICLSMVVAISAAFIYFDPPVNVFYVLLFCVTGLPAYILMMIATLKAATI